MDKNEEILLAREHHSRIYTAACELGSTKNEDEIARNTYTAK